jgi:predicted amidohydrolase
MDYLSDVSKKHEIIIIGSIPEKNGEKLYNTAVCYQNG